MNLFSTASTLLRPSLTCKQKSRQQNSFLFSPVFPATIAHPARTCCKYAIGIPNKFHSIQALRCSIRKQVKLQPIGKFSLNPPHSVTTATLDFQYSIKATKSNSHNSCSWRYLRNKCECNDYHVTKHTYVPRRPCISLLKCPNLSLKFTSSDGRSQCQIQTDQEHPYAIGHTLHKYSFPQKQTFLATGCPNCLFMPSMALGEPQHL